MLSGDRESTIDRSIRPGPGGLLYLLIVGPFPAHCNLHEQDLHMYVLSFDLTSAVGLIQVDRSSLKVVFLRIYITGT
jgi:hypothetical protein